MTINEMVARRDDVLAKAAKLTTVLDAGEELSDEQVDALEECNAEVAQLDEDITEGKRRQSVIAASLANVNGNKPQGVSDVRLASESDPKAGFAHVGEYFQAVTGAGFAAKEGGAIDSRLAPLAGAASTFGSTGTGADGGFRIPDEFNTKVREYAFNEDSFLGLADTNPISGNSMVYPTDETTPWGSDGVTVNTTAEGAAATPSKPISKVKQLRLNKVVSLVPITNELLDDAVAMGAYVSRKMGQKIGWDVNNQLMNGTGAGNALGVQNSGALVTVAKETSQVADTVVAMNVAKMYARNIGRTKAVWVVNDDVLPQIMTLSLDGNLLYAPPSTGFSAAPNGTLMGRPIIPSQTAQTVGDAGDINFIDWSQYVAITKSSGIEYSESIHLYFDADTTAFKAVFRFDGAPWYDAAVTPANGSNTLSHFVTLAARA